MAGMSLKAEHAWKGMEMVGDDWNGGTWQEMAVYGCKWLELAGMVENY